MKKSNLTLLKGAGVGKTPVRDEVLTDNASIDEQLRFAIANKRLIQFTYSGSLRVAEPHDYGVLNGTTMLLTYQRRGGSSSQRPGASPWRLFDVSKIEGCVVLDELFAGSRGQSHRDHYKWDILYARVG